MNPRFPHVPAISVPRKLLSRHPGTVITYCKCQYILLQCCPHGYRAWTSVFADAVHNAVLDQRLQQELDHMLPPGLRLQVNIPVKLVCKSDTLDFQIVADMHDLGFNLNDFFTLIESDPK